MIEPFAYKTVEADPVPKYKIDASEPIQLLERCLERLEKIDGLIAADPKQGRDASARNAVISKELLYLAHLTKKAEVLILDQYHTFKGESGHE